MIVVAHLSRAPLRRRRDIHPRHARLRIERPKRHRSPSSSRINDLISTSFFYTRFRDALEHALADALGGWRRLGVALLVPHVSVPIEIVL